MRPKRSPDLGDSLIEPRAPGTANVPDLVSLPATQNTIRWRVTKKSGPVLLDTVEMPTAKKRAPFPEPTLGNIRQIEDGRYKWRECYSAAPDAATALIEIEAQWLSIKTRMTEIVDHAESVLPKKVMFAKRDAKLRHGEEQGINN